MHTSHCIGHTVGSRTCCHVVREMCIRDSYQTRLNVCDDIGKIIKKEGKTAILVTHDISEAISMADLSLIHICTAPYSV